MRNNNNSYLEKWIRKALLLLKWTLIRIGPIVKTFEELKKTKIKKELENSLVQLKSEFG